MHDARLALYVCVCVCISKLIERRSMSGLACKTALESDGVQRRGTTFAPSWHDFSAKAQIQGCLERNARWHDFFADGTTYRHGLYAHAFHEKSFDPGTYFGLEGPRPKARGRSNIQSCCFCLRS